MKIPTKYECFSLLQESGTLLHIAVHSIQVCRVALLIVDGMAAAAPGIRRDLVQAGALLHDITKTRSLTTGEPHAESGGLYLSERGFPEVGAIVRQHVQLADFRRGGPVTDAEIINYADKRVIHDRIAPLADRMDYILERYGRTPSLLERLTRIREETRELEEKLFGKLPFPPAAVADHLPDEGREALTAEYEQTVLPY